MEKQFWQERWRQGRLGFHRAETNPLLPRHWHRVGLERGERVLVPLCGKTLDMLYLEELGHEVVGVELVESACRDFFSENHRRFDEETIPGGIVFRSGDISIFNLDIIEADLTPLGTFQALYDRAAMIALPPDMRARYARALRSMLSDGASGLLASVEYPQDLKDGPPFSVSELDLGELLSGLNLERLEVTQDEDIDRLEQWGIPWLRQSVYLLTP